MSWTLYGSPISLFTRKLEAALEFYAIEFENVRRDDSNRAALEARAGTHQVPVLATPFGWTLADTTPILMWLDTLRPARRLFPPGAAGVLVHIIEDVLDEWVARVMVHYRWHYADNTRAAIAEVTGTDVSLAAAQQHPLAQWGPRACRATGTESPTQQAAAEAEYLGILAALERQLALTPYALGERPTAVDCALIGGLRGHTLRDPLPDLDAYPRVRAYALDTPRWDGAGAAPDFPPDNAFAHHMLALARAPYKAFMQHNRAAQRGGQKAFVLETYGEEVSYLARTYPVTALELIAERINHMVPPQAQATLAAWLAENDLDGCW